MQRSARHSPLTLPLQAPKKTVSSSPCRRTSKRQTAPFAPLRRQNKSVCRDSQNGAAPLARNSHPNRSRQLGDKRTPSAGRSTFRSTFLADGRIDFAPRLRRLLNLLEPSAITGGANDFDQYVTQLLHNDQSLKQETKLNFAKITAGRATAQRNSVLNLTGQP